MQEQLDRIEVKLAELSGKLDKATQSSEKVRKYLMWGFWITIGTIAVPLLILPLLLPMFLSGLGMGL